MTYDDTAGEPAVRIPRWTAPAGGGPGTGTHTARLPAGVANALERTARDLGATLSALLIAAHARVLATLTNERDLLVGYASGAPDGLQGPLRLAVPDATWADLVAGAAGARTYRGALRPEVALDLSGLAGRTGPAETGLPGGVVLRVAFAREGDGGLALRVTHDTAALDASCAERVAGYHRAALRLVAADPAARHDRQSLLSAREVETQLYDLAGPRTELPRRAFTELFRDRARAAPDAVAAAHGDRRWTYRELDERSDAVARALLAAGLGREDVVAVVLERGLEWIAAALGVFKAGGVHLPVAPDFPAPHVAAQLSLASCAFVLTEPGTEDLARDAAAASTVDPVPLSVPGVLAAGGPPGAPDATVTPDQAAYLYFTSGSTGTPKGAVCEHAGLLNHLLMKADDMGLTAGAGEVVAQTAAQSFDISLWQFAAPLVTGAAVRVVDTAAQLGVDAFWDELDAGRVTVAQVVPSYLETLLTHLERYPRPAPAALRVLSVTGEALGLDLVRRWFARYPGIRLVNAYGATEVCDDTVHEVLDGVPERGFVPLGRSRHNVNTYVLDANLALVPLGSTGEIAFSGVCVGRGYVGDDERTRQAFVPDPFRAGARLYRTGDFGRWLPEGRLEYLGRHDEQVKIRGYRIELGEIENRLLTMPGVREAAVVIDSGAGVLRGLTAFYSGTDGTDGTNADSGGSAPGALSPGRARDFLAALLPDYMVPAYFHRLDRLPRTDHGKADKKALVRLARTLGHGGAPYTAPSTPAEQRLAMLWAEVLGVPLERIGRGDSFFALGGTSLAAVRLLVHLDRALTLGDLAARPVLADLAAVLDGDATGAPGLLQPLSAVRSPRHTLVCFPYEGGNAVNFRSLARELADDGVAVLGVEPPGHDLASTGAPVEVAELARRVAGELAAHGTGPLLLWGHGAGAAPALETARLLRAAGRRVERVFVGGQPLADAAALRARAAEAAAASDRDLLDRLRAGTAYVELDALKPERARVVARACRHDVRTAHTHLARLRADPGAHRVATPLTVVVARDVPDGAAGAAEWKAVADDVTVHEVPGGGPYFVGTRPGDAAGAVRAALGARPGPPELAGRPGAAAHHSRPGRGSTP
ncbi:amino acid adenylation domain-containing protein [Streptomyces longispororuber]|uniref:non-ribosomal peptide synthetase n=1 Tax=Streptomyces longispororuber TaxID=68230 RepID=UPI0033DB671B